jgi:hypothetical protein
MICCDHVLPELNNQYGEVPEAFRELPMGLAELVNSFLQNFYAYFTPPGDQDAETGAASFYESIIMPTMRSPTFRARLLEEPEAVLSEFGFALPEGVAIRFLENTETTIHIVIPPYVGE